MDQARRIGRSSAMSICQAEKADLIWRSTRLQNVAIDSEDSVR